MQYVFNQFINLRATMLGQISPRKECLHSKDMN